MIKITSEIPTDIFDAIVEQVQKTPALVKRGLPRVTRPIDKRMVAELSAEPGPPHYPIRWKSERQRRAFFATNGFGRGIPTRRTGTINRNWKVKTVFTADGGLIYTENDTPYARYVQGDDTQPMHLQTGWPQAAPIVVKYLPIYEDAIIDFWFLIADPFANIPR